ncbi:MAG: polyphosphate kinase 2 [Bdellovibrio sp. CG10_big_fil_rev_8_21_14_0_10_47_8]|nr:MAG: polyphosphate kinase 2 [Bdellovibrio sp. CG10_big_fil_rev_8_21_14_0_10_47_8]
MANYAKEFIVKPGDKIKLKDVRTDFHGDFKSHKKAKPEIGKHLIKMDELQYLMYAEHRHSMLIILQGLDTAGKDGVIRHVLTGLNPQGSIVTGFKQPTPQELDHDFLWRVHAHCPAKGAVAIFNRSDYEDVLITRVHKKISEKECADRFELINDFEKLLVNENRTTILKFFLHISKEEQLERFGDRLKDPSRHWKISDSDYKERQYWDRYMKAYEDVLANTSTKHAPWYVIPSDHKWFRNLAISQIITKSLESLEMKVPPATVNIEKIRRKYHLAKMEQKSKKTKSGFR